ncbi:MAG TPA: hypothetical protein PLR54_08775 [Spirochaetota bacterium]|nr:hypothetical protein [Spirochaetota bacterium]HQK07743.1 hypothetical protein [Spirochaetota bacterium]HRR61747.1 hypothetical protein [Spirochaetota bacterium]
MKYCKIIFLLSLLFLLISCRPSIEKNEDNEKITNENSLKKYEYNRNDIRDIERVIKVLITDKKKSYQTNQSELINITDRIIKDLNKLQKKGYNLKRIVRNYLLLYQYSEICTEETLNEICRDIFIKQPEVIIECLVEINNYLLEEFRNEEYLQNLYKSVCDFPNVFYDDGINIGKEKTNMLRRLLSLKNDKNSKIIDFIIRENLS